MTTPYAAHPMAVSSWKLRAHPDMPLILERMRGRSLPELVLTSDLDVEITPRAENLDFGLYRARTCYVNAVDEAIRVENWYLLVGRYSLFRLDDKLGELFKAVLENA